MPQPNTDRIGYSYTYSNGNADTNRFAYRDGNADSYRSAEVHAHAQAASYGPTSTPISSSLVG